MIGAHGTTEAVTPVGHGGEDDVNALDPPDFLDERARALAQASKTPR